MEKLNDAEITVKSTEISKCLINSSPGIINSELETTRTIGDAARFAVTIKNRDDIISKDVLSALSIALKIDPRLTKTEILPIFEEFNWITIKKDGKNIDGIIEKIPPLEDVLGGLGKLWREKNPTVIESATLNSLNELSKKPHTEESLQSELNMGSKDFDNFKDYGQKANYLGSFISQETGEPILWSPLYWARNSEQVLKFLNKQSDPKLTKLGDLTNQIKDFQGVPLEILKPVDLNLLRSGIHYGYFPTVSIDDRSNNSRQFVFSATPQFDVSKDSDLFEKARIIVSCIRQGQFFPEGTKIKYPRLILNSMRGNNMNPHPYIDIQYNLLAQHNIIKLHKVSWGAWKTEWVNIPENNLAADIADLILQKQESIASDSSEVEARKIMIQGVFRYTAENRKLQALSEIKASRELESMMEILRGVRR